MRRVIFVAVFLAAILMVGFPLIEGRALAGWSLTVDTPETFTFAHSNVNTTVAAGNQPAAYTSQTTTDVSGSKVTLIAPFHIGIGYEDYSVAQNAVCLPCGNNAFVKFRANFQFYDVLVDLPLHWLNVSLGYGMGTARMTAVLPPGNPVISIQPADASQYFLVLGIPFGPFDIHLGYHRITTEEKDVIPSGSPGPYDKAQASGDMLSAGLRLDF
jgi:hypothetical protein